MAGTDIPGALCASWTHPTCDTLLAQEIYGDIYMIQHQIGSGSRADLATLKAVKAENTALMPTSASRSSASARANNASSSRAPG
ncbi:MAG: hypothetical protein KBE22_16525 [Candidatus Accumulibacter sp.]|nr:hypothetical protein [Accumulibacter sp.]